jgi:thiaminase (transcriptional activator TenA)
LLKGSTPNVTIYQEWINAYGGEWFRDLLNEQLNRLNGLALEAPKSEQEKMKQHFIISSQYESMFWDMAYNHEKWPVTL